MEHLDSISFGLMAVFFVGVFILDIRKSQKEGDEK